MKQKDNLLEGDIAPQLRRLSLPLFGGLIAIMSLGIVDTFFVAKLGTDSLSALGFTMPIIMIFISILFGFNVGSIIVISKAYGKGEFEKLRHIATNNLIFSIGFTIIVSILGYIFMDNIFLLMGATKEILPLIKEYMSPWFFSMVFFAVIIIGNSALRGIGDTKTPAILMFSSAVMNAVLDPLLIFGLGPFPKMGISGASIAIVITDIILALVVLYILIIKKKILAKPVFDKSILESWKEMLNVAVPSVFSSIFAHFSNAITIWMMADLGKEAVAAMGVSSRIQSLSIIIFFAISGGVSIFTGQNFGAGNYKRISKVGDIAAKYCVIWGLLVSIVLWIFAKNIAVLFDSNPQVINYTITYLHIVPISYMVVGIIYTSNSILNAIGKPVHATIIILLKVFILYIPLALLGKNLYGFVGILYALAFTNILMGVISHLWNKKIEREL